MFQPGQAVRVTTAYHASGDVCPRATDTQDCLRGSHHYVEEFGEVVEHDGGRYLNVNVAVRGERTLMRTVHRGQVHLYPRPTSN